MVAPATTPNDLANALGVLPSKAYGAMLEPPLVEIQGVVVAVVGAVCEEVID
jgi:hypothetical protein